MRAWRSVVAVAAIIAVSGVAVGCRPEPLATPGAGALTPSASVTTAAPSADAAPSPTSTAPSPSPSPSRTNLPGAQLTLPKKCEDLYSAKMLATLDSANPPLNDPGVTMHATQNADALELLTSGIPTIRCSWGKPSERGLATNVSLITAAQSAAILTALRSAGFSCAGEWNGTICTMQQKTIDQDDNEVTLGESHFLRGTGWVSTAWVNFAPEGYTQDIVSTLWG